MKRHFGFSLEQWGSSSDVFMLRQSQWVSTLLVFILKQFQLVPTTTQIFVEKMRKIPILFGWKNKQKKKRNTYLNAIYLFRITPVRWFYWVDTSCFTEKIRNINIFFPWKIVSSGVLTGSGLVLNVSVSCILPPLDLLICWTFLLVIRFVRALTVAYQFVFNCYCLGHAN